MTDQSWLDTEQLVEPDAFFFQPWGQWLKTWKFCLQVLTEARIQDAELHDLLEDLHHKESVIQELQTVLTSQKDQRDEVVWPALPFCHGVRLIS